MSTVVVFVATATVAWISAAGEVLVPALAAVAIVSVSTFVFHLIAAPRRVARDAAVDALAGTVLAPIGNTKAPPPIDPQGTDRVTFVVTEPASDAQPPVLNRTAAEIFGLFDTLTDHQAGQVVKPLIGHFLTFHGVVQRVRDDHVVLKDADPRQSRKGRVVMAFFDTSSTSKPPPLARGSSIAVRGVLHEVTPNVIHLRDAEVIEPL